MVGGLREKAVCGPLKLLTPSNHQQKQLSSGRANPQGTGKGKGAVEGNFSSIF